MCDARLHIWTKFSENWLETVIYTSENVTISFKHEYRRPTLTSRCDVISDVINIKSTFSGTISDDLSISDVKINLSKIFRNFQNGRHLRSGRSFKPEVVPKLGSYIKIGHAHPYLVSFCLTF